MVEIVMDGPGKNALGTELMDWLLGRIDEARGAPILLTGSGDAFSAGLNLKEIASLDQPGMELFLRRLVVLCERLYRYPGPTAAVVNGHAIAGGALLTLCCDFRVAINNPRARIGLNEVALGLRFPPGIFELVRRRLPRAHLDYVILSAGLYPPEEALRLGYLDEVSEDPMSVARRRLVAMAAAPADAYAAAKSALRGQRSPVSDEEERRFLQEVLPTWSSDALKQRISHILKK